MCHFWTLYINQNVFCFERFAMFDRTDPLWSVQALLFCIVLRCLLEGSSFIAVWSASYFVMLKNFVGVIYQSLRKVCATSGPCTSTRTCFVLNGSRCLIELTRCGRFKLYYSASCFAVCWKVQALLFCIVLRCLLEGSSFIAVWSASYFVMLLKNFVGVIYQSLRKVCATSGPCTSTRTCFVLNGSRCLIELTRCGRKSNQPSSVQIKNVFYCRLSFTMFCSC